jgi:DUF4097 and DUF4098 domain-containing protein YvlB
MSSATHHSSPAALLAAASLIVLAGCSMRTGFGNVVEEETVAQAFTVGAAPKVVVETFNGDIEVLSAADGQVEAEVVKRGAGFTAADAKSDLANIEVRMTQEGDTLRVVARRIQRFPAGNSAARVALRVPASASLDLSTGNGEVRVDGVAGGGDYHTGNGDITVENGSGRTKAHSGNGDVTVEAEGAQVEADTGNGKLIFRGDLGEGSHTFTTGNGEVRLTLPADASFKVDIQTGNGRIRTDFGLSVPANQNTLQGTVGSNPAASIRIRTGNGAVTLVAGR